MDLKGLNFLYCLMGALYAPSPERCFHQGAATVVNSLADIKVGSNYYPPWPISPFGVCML